MIVREAESTGKKFARTRTLARFRSTPHKKQLHQKLLDLKSVTASIFNMTAHVILFVVVFFTQNL